MHEPINNLENLIQKELIGKEITDVVMGYSFIEIELNDGVTWVIESTTEKSTKHQERVDVNIYKEEE